MFANNNMLFVMLNAKSDALGDVTATTTSTKTFAGAGTLGATLWASRWLRLSQRVRPQQRHTRTRQPTGLASGGDLTSSHSGNVSFDSPYGPTPVSLSISSTSVTTVGCRRSLVGESFPITDIDQIEKPEFVRTLIRTPRVGGLSVRPPVDTRLRGRLCVCPPAFDESWSSSPSMTPTRFGLP